MSAERAAQPESAESDKQQWVAELDRYIVELRARGFPWHAVLSDRYRDRYATLDTNAPDADKVQRKIDADFKRDFAALGKGIARRQKAGKWQDGGIAAAARESSSQERRAGHMSDMVDMLIADGDLTVAQRGIVKAARKVGRNVRAMTRPVTDGKKLPERVKDKGLNTGKSILRRRYPESAEPSDKAPKEAPDAREPFRARFRTPGGPIEYVFDPEKKALFLSGPALSLPDSHAYMAGRKDTWRHSVHARTRQEAEEAFKSLFNLQEGETLASRSYSRKEEARRPVSAERHDVAAADGEKKTADRSERPEKTDEENGARAANEGRAQTKQGRSLERLRATMAHPRFSEQLRTEINRRWTPKDKREEAFGAAMGALQEAARDPQKAEEVQRTGRLPEGQPVSWWRTWISQDARQQDLQNEYVRHINQYGVVRAALNASENAQGLDPKELEDTQAFADAHDAILRLKAEQEAEELQERPVAAVATAASPASSRRSEPRSRQVPFGQNAEGAPALAAANNNRAETERTPFIPLRASMEEHQAAIEAAAVDPSRSGPPPIPVMSFAENTPPPPESGEVWSSEAPEAITAAALVQKYWDGMSRPKRWALSAGLIAAGAGITLATGGAGAAAVSFLGLGSNTLAGWMIGGAVGSATMNAFRSGVNLRLARKKAGIDKEQVTRKTEYFVAGAGKAAAFGAVFGALWGMTGAGEIVKDKMEGWLESRFGDVPPADEPPPPVVSLEEQLAAVKGQLAEADAKVAGLNEQLEAAQRRIAELAERVGELEAEAESPDVELHEGVHGGPDLDERDLVVERPEPSSYSFTVGEDVGSVWEGLSERISSLPGLEKYGEQGALAMLRSLTDALGEMDHDDAMEYLRTVFPGADDDFLEQVIEEPLRFDRTGNLIADRSTWAWNVPSGTEFDPAALQQNETFMEELNKVARSSSRTFGRALMEAMRAR